MTAAAIATYADAYAAYLASGLGGPLPLRAGTKHPPPTGWTGWDAEYPSAADCEEWASNDPDYRGTTQLGLRLASTVIAIDVDAYDGKRGADTMREALRRWGALPAGPWSTSRDDGTGAIRPFRVPDGTVLAGKLSLTLPSGETISDVEIIQLQHRYMLCAPSIHPKTGLRYRWHRTAGPDIPPHIDDLPELPQTWLDALSRAAYDAENVEPGQVREFVAGLPGGPPCPPVQRVLGDALLAVRDAGSRHDTMLANVLRVLRLGEQGHAGAHYALDRLRDALVMERTQDGTGTRGSTNGEFDRMVYGDRGVGAILATPTSPMDKGCCPVPTEPAGDQHMGEDATENTENTENEEPPAEPDYSAAIEIEAIKERIRRAAKRKVDVEERGAPRPPSSTPLPALLAEPDVDPPWRIADLMAAGSKTMLVAPMKSGKTTLVGNLVKALADGTPFLGTPQGRQGFGGLAVTPLPAGRNIMLLDFEMPRRKLKDWLRHHGIADGERVHVETLRGQAWDIRDDSYRAQWAKHLRELNIAILIVDPIGPALFSLNIDESHNTEVGKFLFALDALVAESEASELFVAHHMGHNGERGRGASVLRGWPDQEWRLVRDVADDGAEPQPSDPKFLAAMGRDVEFRETVLEFDADTKHLWLGMGNRRTVAVDKYAAAVVEAVTKEPGITKRDLEAAVPGRATAIRGALDALIRSGSVHVHAGSGKTARGQYHHPGPSCEECSE